MPLIRAFSGLRPSADRAVEVAAPPYDVMSRDEALQMVQGRPWSFLHISRPEVDFPGEVDPYDNRVYAKARENLQKMIEEGVLVRDPNPCYYVYRMTMGAHVQTGLVAAASVDAYNEDRIKKHEFTRPVKEDDRVCQIDALDAHTGPVLLVYPSDQEIDSLLSELARGDGDLDVTDAAGVRHQIWVVDQEDAVERLTRDFDRIAAIYVADGHHRSAAAARVAAERRMENPQHTGEEPYNYFLSVLFPHQQMQILDYNRVIRDLNGLDPDQFLDKVGIRFSITPSDDPVRPAERGEFGMFFRRRWYRLKLDQARIPWDDPVLSLDVSLLSSQLIEPILGIKDPRRDERIEFIGGIRGLKALEQRVESGEMAVAFSLCPTSMKALMAVSDAGEVMPPKSTWFEPKLADGLVSHLLQD